MDISNILEYLSTKSKEAGNWMTGNINELLAPSTEQYPYPPREGLKALGRMVFPPEKKELTMQDIQDMAVNMGFGGILQGRNYGPFAKAAYDIRATIPELTRMAPKNASLEQVIGDLERAKRFLSEYPLQIEGRGFKPSPIIEFPKLKSIGTPSAQSLKLLTEEAGPLSSLQAQLDPAAKLGYLGNYRWNINLPETRPFIGTRVGEAAADIDLANVLSQELGHAETVPILYNYLKKYGVDLGEFMNYPVGLKAVEAIGDLVGQRRLLDLNLPGQLFATANTRYPIYTKISDYLASRYPSGLANPLKSTKVLEEVIDIPSLEKLGTGSGMAKELGSRFKLSDIKKSMKEDITGKSLYNKKLGSRPGGGKVSEKPLTGPKVESPTGDWVEMVDPKTGKFMWLNPKDLEHYNKFLE